MNRQLKRSDKDEGEIPIMNYRRQIIVLGVVLVVGLVAFFMSFHNIPAGHRGLFLEWGATTGRLAQPGAAFTVPIAQSLKLVDTRVIAHPFKGIEAASRELLSVKMAGTLNYRIDPEQIIVLYNTVGLDFPEKVLDSALLDFMKEVAPKYSINDMLAKRDEIRASAIERLSRNLSRYGILINDVYIADITFPAQFAQSIEDKQVAEQRVLTEKQILEQIKIKANQAEEQADGSRRSKIKEAEGEAQATLTKATAQAKANELLAASLTQEVIDFNLTQKLGDKVEVMIIPSGQQLFLSPSELRKAAAPAAPSVPAVPAAPVVPKK